MSGNQLPKVTDKSQADIDAAIDAIKASNIPTDTKDFAISCIKLAVWSNDAGQSDTKNETKDSDDLNPTEEPASTETTVTTNQVPTPGHGRLPHSAFTNTIEHQLSIPVLEAGDLCPCCSPMVKVRFDFI